jgi:hypothetical protein
MKKEKRFMNKGIHANNVTAEVLAVGDKAQAVKYSACMPQEDLSRAISDLRKAIAELNINENARTVVDEDINKLEHEMEKVKPNKAEVGGILQSISGKLKMVGVVLSDTVSLVEPIKKIAGFLGITVKLLGLFS